ncbi:cytochrome P450 [Rhypophila decipiens]|uniref:Cytochrome P450 n=1 Tax=Rhypophila decipiens TaxID=261697 RepID=A0AAN7B3Q4_9PEZI|nr:cytochrome P450 [Rhypophila decipiens]
MDILNNNLHILSAHPTLLLTTLLIPLLYLLTRQLLLPKPIPQIPYDPAAASQILGDVPSLESDPSGLALWAGHHLARLKTPLCQVFMGPLAKPMVLVADIGNARDIMFFRSDFDRSDYILNRFPLFKGFHFRMKTGEQWKLSRGWVKDLMGKEFLGSVGKDVVYGSVRRLVGLWEVQARLAGTERAFSMTHDLRALALDVISGFYLGGEFEDWGLQRQLDLVGKLGAESVKAGQHGEVIFPKAEVHRFTEGMILVGDRLAAIYDAVNTKLPPGLVSFWFRYVNPSFGHFFRAKDRFLGRILDLSMTRLGEEKKPSSGVDYMVAREDKAAQRAGRKPLVGGLRQTMIDEVYGNLIAGQHTTSAALVWILKFVTENPDVQENLKAEVAAVVGGEERFPTGEELAAARLPYHDAVIEETMRLRASFLMPRDAVRATELLGYRIPKGTICVLVSQGHQLESTGDMKKREYPGAERANPNLEVFDPERWLVRNEATGEITFDGSSYPQMAFGLGPRGCWGRKLAQMEMRMMLALVVWRFELLPVLPDALSNHDAGYDISYRAKNGYLRLRIKDELKG